MSRKSAKVILVFVTAIIVASMLAFSCAPVAPEGPPTEGPKEPILIGYPMDATGGLATLGLPNIAAAVIAIDEINAAGGVLGRPVKLIHYDTQTSNELYTQYTTQLIVEDNVAVVIGGITSASREAIRPVTDRYNMLYIYPTYYEGGCADKLLFCMGSTPEQQIKPTLPWMIEKYGPKFYSVAADYNAGWIMCDWAEVYAEQYGGEVVGEEFIPLEVAEFGTTIAKIQTANPDWVYSILVGANHFAFWRQWAAVGLQEQYPTFSITFGALNEHFILSPDESAGIYVAYPYFEELDNPVNKALVTEFKRRNPDIPAVSYVSAANWTALHLWAIAVNQAGTLEQDAVIAALESGLEFDSPWGLIQLDPATHHVITPMYMAQANRNQGFDIVEELGIIAPLYEQETFDLIKDPDINECFTPFEYY